MTTTTYQNRTFRLLIAGGTATALLGLVACGSDPAEAERTTTTTVNGSTTAARSAGPDALLAAAKLVVDAVPDSSLTSIETDRGGWEVQVSDADGTESEALVSADGSSITRAPVRQDDDAQDRAEHQRFVKAATVSYDDAVSAINQAAPGSITELGLDDHLGTVVWEADVENAGQPKVSVRIDAATGKVVTQTTEQPGDDD